MLLSTFFISFPSLLVLFSLGYISSSAFAVPSRFPFDFDPLTKQTHTHKRPWTILRDHIIRRIWSLPQSHEPNRCGYEQPSKPPDLALPPRALSARYGADVVLRFNFSNAEEAEALADATNILFLDVWESTSDWADIRLAKDMVPSLLGLLPKSLEHSHTPLIHDLAQAIHESYPGPAPEDDTSSLFQQNLPFTPTLSTSTKQAGKNIFFSDYRPLSVIKPWMRLMQSLFDSHVRLISIGTSSEGRDIPALRVGVHPTNSEKPSEPRKTIIVLGGLHAREWISTSTVNYVAFSLISSYGKSQDTTKLLEEFDWIFIPTLNPDGYVFSWENDRLWRKNRQQTSLRFCQGIDLDRAWGYQWDGARTKGNPCSESFTGDEPFEAVEAREFAKWAKNETVNNNVQFVGFLDLHSYSQQVLYPYSYSCSWAPPNLEDLQELGEGLAKAIRLAPSREKYAVASACEGSVSLTLGQNGDANKGKDKKIYPRLETGGGSALDWFHHELGIKYAYQIKLRDTGSYGFLLPKENIVPTGIEAFRSITYFGHYLLGNKGVEVEEEEEEEEEEDKRTVEKQRGITTTQLIPQHVEPLARGEAVADGTGDDSGKQGDSDDEPASGNWEYMELKKRRRRMR